MNEILFSNRELARLRAAEYLVIASPFVHVDRIAPFHVLIYVTSGTIYVTEDGVPYDVQPGELLFLKSGVHHWGQRQIPAGTSWYYLHFELPPCGEPPFDPSDRRAGQIGALALPKKLTGLTGSQLERMIRDYVGRFEDGRSTDPWNDPLRLHELLTACALWESSAAEEPPSLADELARYLQEHCGEAFRSEALEARFYLSYKHLAEIFRKNTGMSPLQYHYDLQMREACRLLRTTTLGVSEIAARLGFAIDPAARAAAAELKSRYTVVMVTHNMQQAARISDNTAFFLLGELVEFGKTEQLFSTPADKRTEDYITGRFG